MDIDNIKQEYQQDIVWEFGKIDKYLMRLPSIISKYQNHWFKLKRHYDKLEKDYDDKWIARFLYYKHDFDLKLTNTEIKDFLTKDAELNEIKSNIKKVYSYIELVEKMLKNLDSIRWDIKNVIEFEKFRNGEF